ncbi:MAG: C40 family peptidase [Burkholderiales bacterium]|nr:C40 family peptidase [Burkholderiales bacterium]
MARAGKLLASTWLCVSCFVSVADAQAQQLPSAFTASASAPSAAPQSSSTGSNAPSGTNGANGVATPSSGQSGDLITRFLVDKGLVNPTPVIELAQQMRDKASDVASQLVTSAMDFLGVRYRRGGESPETGFDCSGFTRHVFENSVGLILPRRASEQANSPDLVPVSKNELKPGDLVFFNTLRHTFSHVGIYMGDNKFIHSPRAGGAVRVEDMREAYWQKRFDGARRAPTINARENSGLTSTKTSQAQQ